MKRFEILFKQVAPYVLIFAAAFCLMFFGSKTPDNPVKTPIAANFDNTDFTVTADQVSESYTVANIASALSLPSTSTISENYVTINDIYETTGTTSTSSTSVVEKPTVIDTSSLQRGIISHSVVDGDTFQSIYDSYKAYGFTKDQLRWSNGLKKETVTVGNTLYIPSVAGIVYKVKSGETLDKISEKTGSPKDQIISYNDLEDSDIAVDQLLLLPNGTLPEKERPEYVAPTPRPTYTPSYTYSYVRDIADRPGAAYIAALLGSTTLAPLVTVLGLLGIGAAIIWVLNTGSQLALSAMLVAGYLRSVVLIGLVALQPTVQLCNLRAVAMATSQS